MCGIAAILGAIPSRQVELSLRAMLDAQLHRGPDDGGWVVVPTTQSVLGLGNRRLAIQDVSPLGHQPMRNEDTGDLLVYNGEIYNAPQLKAILESEGYRFRGHSDTEILLRAYEHWGIECLNRLRGMFAFAVWDAGRSRLIVARDHLGIKPLYYSCNEHCFVCASEIRALLQSGLVSSNIDRRALAGYLAYGAVQEPFTIFENLYSLSRGSWREMDRTGKLLAEGKYWRFPPVQHSIGEQSLPDVVEEGRALLQEAVHRHLLSDVRLGVFLSSGLDSTAILGLSCGQDRIDPIDAFTVTFPDWPQYNEQEQARVTAARFGARFHECPITDTTALSWIGGALQCMDQPSMDGFNTYIVARAVREQGIVVALSGLGGDEVFGGYNIFRRVPWTYNAMSWLSPLPRATRITAARLATVVASRVAKHKAREIAVSDPGLIGLYFQYRRLVSDVGLSMLGFDAKELGLSEDLQLRGLRYEDSYVPADHLASVGRLDASFYLQNILLRDSDVFGMANSLEIRVPFLDRDLVEWAFRLPGPVLLPSKAPLKHLLRKVCVDLYAGAQIRQPKRGFTLPFAGWMLGPLREITEENIRVLRRSALLDPAGIDDLQTLFRREPHGPAWSRVWALVTLGHWLRTVATTRFAAEITAHSA
jgi:asparagine synthase (glutamine-hydrolysing)